MKADLALCLHFHQPVGNFDFVFERACDNCYTPFLEILKNYPDIKMSFNFTGCLLEWVEDKRPAIINTVRELVKRGQVEIISGGFYEPILPSIPPRTRLAQIRMLNEYIEKKFSYKAEGAWIAERVWEPELPSYLHDAGIKYLILDDTHFIYSGISKENTYGYYITEDDAKVVSVFASDKILRYHIPFKMPKDCIGYMRSVAERKDNPLFVYGDDGEKFGEWPGTHKWVYEEKWLENFFKELIENRSWLRTVKLSDSLSERRAEGRVYIGTASYEEMLEWSLPADVQLAMKDMIKHLDEAGRLEMYKPFIRGGFWRSFFAKYPEANNMNKKMVYVNKKLERLKASRKDKDSLAQAEKELLRGQCNCAYWHGVFGGLYLFHLRRAIYHHLVKSEFLMDRILYGKKNFCAAEILDVDADGEDEIVMENRKLSLYFDPAEGGALKELDAKSISQNLINSLARRKEAYHEKIREKIDSPTGNSGGVKTIHDDIQSVDAGLKDHLTYDWYNRYGLLDHFVSEDTDIKSFAGCEYGETGDFVKGVYDYELKKSSKRIVLIMKREGTVNGSSLRLIKEITLPEKDAFFTVKYTIKNMDKRKIQTIFGPEINVTMPDADSPRYALIFNDERSAHALGETVQKENVKKIRIHDDQSVLSYTVTLSEACRLWHFPVKTVSQSEKAYELNYQSSAIFPHIKLDLESGEEKCLTLNIEIS